MGEFERAMAELVALPCRCVICLHCNGSGKDYDPFDYSGGDGFSDCPHCDGEPLREMCDRCIAIEELERDE